MADRRATEEAARLDQDFQVLTGVVPDAGTVAAKVAWIRRHEPERLTAVNDGSWEPETWWRSA